MIGIAIAVYIVGLLVLYVWGQLNNGWYEYYYIWDKCKDLLILIGLYVAVPKKYKFIVLATVIFSIIRLIWQIISTLTGWNINNVKAVGFLFIILLSVCSLLIFKDLIKWRKSNGR